MGGGICALIDVIVTIPRLRVKCIMDGELERKDTDYTFFSSRGVSCDVLSHLVKIPDYIVRYMYLSYRLIIPTRYMY